jgi:hypothetical protein
MMIDSKPILRLCMKVGEVCGKVVDPPSNLSANNGTKIRLEH